MHAIGSLWILNVLMSRFHAKRHYESNFAEILSKKPEAFSG